MDRDLQKRSPLFDAYAMENGLKLTTFAGWELPLRFSAGTVAEHLSVRKSVGLFDVSHMVEILVSGPGATELLSWLLTVDPGALNSGWGRYSLICNEEGGCIDDCILFCTSPGSFLIIVNSGNISRVHEWIKKNSQDKVDVEDRSRDFFMIALQGPSSRAILDEIGAFGRTMSRFSLRQGVNIAGVSCFVSRTGYTGEEGFEILGDSEDGEVVWRCLRDAVVERGGLLCGLGARDSLRFEASLPLYGHEISEEISPIEAGLRRFVDFQKGEFCGRNVLYDQASGGASRKLLGCEMLDPSVPRAGCRVFRLGREVGFVTSGMKTLYLGKFNALILVDSEAATLHEEVEIEIHGKKRLGKIIGLPFYRGGSAKLANMGGL